MNKKIVLCLLALILFGFWVSISVWKGSKSKFSVINLRAGHDMPINSPQHKALTRYKNLVFEKSIGKINIEIFPNQSLGSDPKMISMVSEGTLDISLPPASKLAFEVPEFKIFDIPFLFEDRNSLYQALESSVTKNILKKLEKIGISAPSIWEAGFKQFSANKLINSPEDFSGLKFRVMRNQILKDQTLSLNAFYYNIGFHQIYKELVSGTIDGQENPINSIYHLNIYKAQPYILLSDHSLLPQVFIISKKTLNKLDNKYSEILTSTAIEVKDYQRKLVLSSEKKNIEIMKKYGVSIKPVKNKKKFIDKFKSVYFKNRDLIKIYRNLVSKDVLPFLSDYHVIGFNLAFGSQFYDSAISLKRGAEIAIDDINSQGGISGKKLMLLTFDHGGFPAKGIKNINSAVKEFNAIALIGGMHSPVVISELDQINKIRIPYLIPWAAATPIVSKENPFLFRVSVRDEFAGSKLVNFALSKSKKLSLIAEDTAWGQSNEKSIRIALNGLPISTYNFSWGTKNFSKMLAKIKKNDIGAIIYVGNAPEAVNLVNSMKKANLFLPIISHWGITGGLFFKQSKNLIENIELNFLQTFIYEKGRNLKKLDHFFDRYRKKFKLTDTERIPAPFGTVHVYDVISMLANALKKSDSFTGEEIAKNLKSIDHFQGLIKNYKKPFQYLQDALEKEDIKFGKYDENGDIIYAH